MHEIFSHSPLPFIQPHLVGDHCDELAVRGLPAQTMDGITEVAVEDFDITSVPCDLDGMTNGNEFK